MNNRRAAVHVFFLVSMTVFVSAAAWSGWSQAGVRSTTTAQAVGPRQYVLLIDFNSLNCSLCTAPLASFLRTVKEKNVKNIAGIIVCERALLKSEVNRKIIRKQVRGFALGFDIEFPLGLDEDGSFAPLGRITAALLVIDGGRKILEKYPVPMKKEDLERILF